MTHIKHKNTIENYENIYLMISLIDESKTRYVIERLEIHLHSSQIKLLKEAYKHSKPHHKQVRTKQYQKLLKEPDQLEGLFKIHKNLYIKKYQKLEEKSLVIVNTECVNPPYDVSLTKKGEEIIKKIDKLEGEWENVVLSDIEDKNELLRLIKEIANNAMNINYKHKKEQKFVF